MDIEYIWSYGLGVMTADFESASLGSIPSKTSHVLLFVDTSLVAQLVEHSTVNRKVAGSSPAERAIRS